MSRYWSKTVRNITPYVPGEQPKDRRYIKLNTNENPYPPSPKALKAIREAANDTLRLYPDPAGDDLRQVIADTFRLERDNIFVGNGSDEILAFCFPAFFEPAGQPILFAEITYSFYPVYAQFFNIPYRLIPMDDVFDAVSKGYLQENGGILITNPNAPSGKAMSLAAIGEIVTRNENSVVMLDEAYVDFGAESAVGMIRTCPNLLVIRTLSKSHSLAGLRVGFAMGHQDLIEGLMRVKDSFNSYTVDRLALAGAAEAIRDDAYFQETRSKIIQTRKRVTHALEAMGFDVVPSMANFIFTRHTRCPGRDLFLKLRDRGILVRYFDKPRISDFIRITMGTDEEMDSLLNATADILS